MTKGFKSGGRTVGTPNRNTPDVRMLANEYTAEAVSTLVNLMRNAESEATRLTAARELLDRAVCRPALHADIRTEVQARARSYAEMSNAELDAIIAEARAGREEEGDAGNGETADD